jgi:nucleotide-binding universal stress UspA family protein
MRLLLALDQFESGQSALDYATGFAVETSAAVWVFHMREIPNSLRIPPMETVAEADALIDKAVICLRRTGVSAAGRSVSVRQKFVADRLAEEASQMKCDAIVLGSQRLRGMRRLAGRGLRDHLLRHSSLPVVVAPTPLQISSARLRSSSHRGGGNTELSGAAPASRQH